MRSILTLLFGWLWFKATSKCSGLLGPVEARKQFASHTFALLTSTGHIQFVMVSHTTTGSKKTKVTRKPDWRALIRWSLQWRKRRRRTGTASPSALWRLTAWRESAWDRTAGSLRFRRWMAEVSWLFHGLTLASAWQSPGRRWIATQSGAWMAWTFSGGRMPEVLATHSPLQSQLVFGWNCLFYVLWKQNNIVVTWLGHTWPRF